MRGRRGAGLGPNRCKTRTHGRAAVHRATCARDSAEIASTSERVPSASERASERASVVVPSDERDKRFLRFRRTPAGEEGGSTYPRDR